MPPSPTPSLPRIVVHGAPFERGRQYGRRARVQIHRSIAAYREVFRHRAGLDWAAAVGHARSYEAPIEAFAPAILQELWGIAEGAGLERGDILALNARSELMFAAAGRRATRAADPLVDPVVDPGECSSFAVLPEAASGGRMLIGQNWDWLPFALDTTILLEVHRDDGPSFATVVEAGLLAKVGFNAAGLGVCTNTLVSTLDDGRPGVPYHVLLRALLDCETMTAATRTLYAAQRAFSANYLIAHADGLAADIETVPGGRDGVRVMLPEDGILAHANHFAHADLARLDARVALHPHSLYRRDALWRALRRSRPAVTRDQIMAALRDHANHPDGVCSHPDPRLPSYERRATVASIIADLTAGEISLTLGQPCGGRYETYPLRAALARPAEAMAGE